MQHEVFISYHRNSSAELVEHIVTALESHGIKCWYAPRDVDSSYASGVSCGLTRLVSVYLPISVSQKPILIIRNIFRAAKHSFQTIFYYFISHLTVHH